MPDDFSLTPYQLGLADQLLKNSGFSSDHIYDSSRQLHSYRGVTFTDEQFTLLPKQVVKSMDQLILSEHDLKWYLSRIKGAAEPFIINDQAALDCLVRHAKEAAHG